MEKKELKKKLDALKENLISNSKDAAFAKKLITDMLSVKGQIDVEQTEVFVSAKDVIGRQNFGSFEIVKCKTCMIYHTFGGLTTMVSVRLVNLHEHLSYLYECMENKESLDENQVKCFTAILNATSMVMMSPMFAATSDKWLTSIANAVVDILKDLETESENSDLQEETPKENLEFVQGMEIVSDIMEGVKNAGNK